MVFMFLSDFLRFSLAFFAGVFALAAAPFVVAHVVDHWDAPEYPYSGFCPDCPVWGGNTLPSVQEFGVEGGAR